MYWALFTKVKILHCTSMSKVQNDDGEETQVRYTRHFLKWRCSCYICGYFRYIQGLREGEIRRRKGFICLKKNTALCAHSFFDGLAKLNLGFWARHLPKIMRISDTPPLLVSPDMLNQHAINQSKNNFKPWLASFNHLATFHCCWGALREQITAKRNFIC